MKYTVMVLDHGLVRLVDYMGSDLSVVRAARVSYDAAWGAGVDEKSDLKLIKYLWKNKHTTPFESVTFTWEIKAPIFVFRQWHRHRTQSFNELSARYKEIPREFYIPETGIIGEQSTDNKQGRQSSDINRTVQLEMMKAACSHSFDTYDHLIVEGWPRELARCVLPLNTYSHMFCTMNLLNLFKFLTLRCDSHAQYEIRVYAEAMRNIIGYIVPECLAAWRASDND